MGEVKWPRIPPGEFLQDFLVDWELTPQELAAKARLPESCVVGILEARHAITKKEAKRFKRCFGVSAEFWLHLQATYDYHEEAPEDGVMAQDCADCKR